MSDKKHDLVILGKAIPAESYGFSTLAGATIMLGPRNRVVCKDGFSISIQANKYAYCEPKRDTGPWKSVELGFPSSPEQLIFEYAEKEDDYVNSVYGYVPIEVVEAMIILHGGFADE